MIRNNGFIIKKDQQVYNYGLSPTQCQLLSDIDPSLHFLVDND